MSNVLKQRMVSNLYIHVNSIWMCLYCHLEAQQTQNASVTGRLVVKQEEHVDNDIRPTGNENESHDENSVAVNKTWGWNQWDDGVTVSSSGIDLGLDLPSINEPVTKITLNRGNKTYFTTSNTNLNAGNTRPTTFTQTHDEKTYTSNRGIGGRISYFK